MEFPASVKDLLVSQGIAATVWKYRLISGWGTKGGMPYRENYSCPLITHFPLKNLADDR